MTVHRTLARTGARLAAMAALALLCACSSERELPTGEPSFYRSMAAAGAQVDAATAASMISGYRTNNGLTAVTVDPALMKMAEAQAQAMASRDKLDHDVLRTFHDRLKQGYRARTAAENVSAGYHTLAEAFSGLARTRRRIAPTCCSTARPAWASPRPTRRNRNSRCSGRSFSPSLTTSADSVLLVVAQAGADNTACGPRQPGFAPASKAAALNATNASAASVNNAIHIASPGMSSCRPFN